MLALRRAVMAALKADAGLTALVPASDVHPQAPVAAPAWPFIRMGSPSAVPREAACLAGEEISFDVHAFAKPRYDGAGAMVETAEDHAHRIVDKVKGCLHRAKLPLADDGTATLRLTQRQVMIDGATPDAFHGVATFRAKVSLPADA